MNLGNRNWHTDKMCSRLSVTVHEQYKMIKGDLSKSTKLRKTLTHWETPEGNITSFIFFPCTLRSIGFYQISV